MEKIIATASNFEAIKKFADKFDEHGNLQHLEFLKHYYFDSPYSDLHIYLDAAGEIVGTMGIEEIPYQYDGESGSLFFGSNWFASTSLAGASTYRLWTDRNRKNCLSFGGTESAHNFFRGAKWQYFEGFQILVRSINSASKLNSQANTAIIQTGRQIDVGNYSLEGDITPFKTGFNGRFYSKKEYLKYRYNPTLKYISYKWVSIIEDGEIIGLAIFNCGPKEVVLSYCDGIDPVAVAGGVLKGFAKVLSDYDDLTDMKIRIGSCSPEMIEVWKSANFKISAQRTFAMNKPIAGLTGPQSLTQGGWNVALDVGDNCLRDRYFR
ncbi:hypothetical protein [Pseudomonas sp. EL_65y_Pfl2_R96]|uniref:hypothetical protein n=1 Tax=Pseudomonas sp. EL_65y_Pfl2_R96 TaxID=3088699 RepID=UPI0030D8BEA3